MPNWNTSPDPDDLMLLSEFQRRNCVSRQTLNRMRRDGTAPGIVRVRGRNMVSYRNEGKWRRSLPAAPQGKPLPNTDSRKAAKKARSSTAKEEKPILAPAWRRRKSRVPSDDKSAVGPTRERSQRNGSEPLSRGSITPHHLAPSALAITDNPYLQRDRTFERLAIKAFSSRGASQRTQNEAEAIADCEPPTFCNHWACCDCRHRHWRKDYLAVHDIVRHLNPSDLSFATVIMEATHDGVDAAANALARQRDLLRAALGHDDAIGWRGRFEVDCIVGEGIRSKLHKMSTLCEIGYDPDDPRPAFVVTAHLLLIHPNIKGSVVAWLLGQVFTATGAVVVKSLHDNKTNQENCRHILRYPLKASFEQAMLPHEWGVTDDARTCVFRKYNRLMRKIGSFKGLRLSKIWHLRSDAAN